MMNKLILSILGVICPLFLCACGQEAEPVEVPSVSTLGFEYVDFARPQMKPHIILDSNGYSTGSKKALFVDSKITSDIFEVQNISTGEKVYTGKLTEVSEGEKSLYIGEFSDLTTAGSYRVYQEDIGYSYDFKISPTLGEEQYEELYGIIKKHDCNSISDRCYRLAALMLTKEIYKDSHIDDLYIRNEIYKLNDDLINHINYPSYIEAVGVLADYACKYAEEDSELAANCIDTATKAFTNMVKYKDSVADDIWYYTNAQLFRTTADPVYHSAIAEYDEKILKKNSDKDYTLLADIIYMNTPGKIDIDRCDQLMKGFMKRAAEIADMSDKRNMYVRADIEKLDEQQLLDDMIILSVLDYVLSDREYSSIKGEYMHYLGGRNAQNVNRFKENFEGRPKGQITDDILSLGKLIFILDEE